MANLTNIELTNLIRSLKTTIDSTTGVEFTEGHAQTLDHIKYNPQTRKLEADRAVETTLNSFYLGEQHKMSSGSENIYFTNLSSNTNWYPMWGGITDQSVVANQEDSGVYAPSARVFGSYGVAQLGGAPVLNTAIPYDGDNYFGFNISGMGITTVVAEEVPAHIRLKYELSVNGTAVYDQILEHTGLSVNETLSWFFDHPLDIVAGSTNHASIRKIDVEEEDLGLLLVCEGDDITTWGGVRYQTSVQNRLFDDKNIAFSNDLESLDIIGYYDLYVDPTYVGTNSDGSNLKPYTSLATAIGASSSGNKIFIKGDNIISSEIVLPHGLSLYGIDGTKIRYASYNSTNANLLKFTGTDNSAVFIFKNIEFNNAGEYALKITGGASSVDVIDCKFRYNGWNGTGLNTVVAESFGVLGYNSSQADLQAFYAGTNASNGGAMRLETITNLQVVGNKVLNNLRGIRVADCGINGNGFITRNVSAQNIESGIYLSVGALGGCQNITVTMNFSAYNSNNGLLVIGGINNKFSQNEVNGNWNAGFMAWGSANTTLRDCGLYDNNRSTYNGIGSVGDAKSSVCVADAYNLLGTQISLNPAARFICEILDTQVHYTGLGSNTEKIGFLIASSVGALADNDKNIIKIDDVGFIGQDYAIDLSEVDITNLRLSLGDNSYQTIGQNAVKPPVAGMYNELPFSNHVMKVPKVDVVVDTLKQTITLHEDVGGNVINSYKVNELQSVIEGSKVHIIQKGSDKIQLRDVTLGNTYINGVVAGSNLQTMNDSLNASFSMNLVQYKTFLESDVGIEADATGNSATFYYIESPDGVFHYPLFKTEAEANTVDTSEGGGGSSHIHTYTDDLTGTNWYMPTTNSTMSGSSAPVNGIWNSSTNVIWNVQTTGADANYAPTFNNIVYTIAEQSAVNAVYKPAGDSATYNITSIPTGYADTGYSIVGTAEEITDGIDIQYIINVTKVNEFGSSVGTITLNITDDPTNNVDPNDTSWTKAVDFGSGSNEYLKMIHSATAINALRMGGVGQTVNANTQDTNKTSDSTYARPWATTVVFTPNSTHGAGEYIWNSGNGSANNMDNIAVRLSSGHLYFSWGRDGYQTIAYLGGGFVSTKWYGLYIAHKGQRYSGTTNSSALMADAFDIRLMSSDDNFSSIGSNLSTSGAWGTVSNMARSITGSFTVGGQYDTKSFHGKVASLITTTLELNRVLPTDAEIKVMITDPIKWLADYRVGNPIRKANTNSTVTFYMNTLYPYYAVQVWLMGDGSNDSYTNGVRNQVYINDQGATKLSINNMVSNDIVNVNIPGLT